MFRDVDYLLNEFDISYAYSATFLAESPNLNFMSTIDNSTIAFAPDYTETIDIQDLSGNQKSVRTNCLICPMQNRRQSMLRK